MLSSLRRALAVVIAIGVLSWAPGASAEPTEAEKRLAQSLFDRGRQLMEAGDFARACPAFAESQRLDPGGGTLLNLALCNERAGKLATAHVQFNEALSGALRDGRRDRQEIAEEHLAAIGPKLSRVAVDVPRESDSPSLRVTLDGVEVPRSMWGTLTPVDGGAHRIEASAPDHEPWSVTLQVAAESDTKRMRVPALAKLPSAESPPAEWRDLRRAETCPDGRRPTASGCPPAETARSGTPPWLGYATLGLGGAALVIGATTGIIALNKSSELDTACDSQNRCPRRLESDVDSYNRMSTASTISFVAAGALVTAGVIQLAVAKKSSNAAVTGRSARLRARAGPARR